jgi:osmotically-inducible protein OsmY
MFHFAARSVTYALITASAMSFTVAVQQIHAAPAAAVATQQTQSDADLTAKIRQAITDDKALAAYASTIKIIVSDGLVSLKGPVKSEADKKAIGAKVDAIAGANNVMNNLFVSSEPAKPQTR